MRDAYMDIGDAPAEFRLAAAYAGTLTPELRKTLNNAVRARVIPRAIGLYARAPGATSTGNRLPFVTARTVKVTQRSGVITGLKFGSSRKLKGGGSVDQLLRPVEFGSAGTGRVTYARVSPKGNRHDVTRRTTTAFAPRRKTGRVIWPATYDSVAPMVLAAYTAAVFDLARGGA